VSAEPVPGVSRGREWSVGSTVIVASLYIAEWCFLGPVGWVSTVLRMVYGCTPSGVVDTMVMVMADGRGGKITWWVIKYPYTKKNAQRIFDPVAPISGL